MPVVPRMVIVELSKLALGGCIFATVAKIISGARCAKVPR